MRKLKTSKGRQPATRLGAGIDRVLSAYAVAAAASGVSLLALAPPAEARIMYTPANTTIPLDGSPVLVDLNQDGVADFSLSQVTYSSGQQIDQALQAGAKNQGNVIWGKGFTRGQDRKLVFASALRAGFEVGPSKPYLKEGSHWLMAHFIGTAYKSTSSGQWLYTKRRYLGLKFAINGQSHYGWARFTVNLTRSAIEATLTGYAYETIPNKPIITGKTRGPDVITLAPVGLGHLAQGASGIRVWREKK
jgi:hypothetical protein